MACFALTPILAAPVEFYRLVILALLMLGGTVLKKITDAREQAERAKGAKTPPARPSAAPLRRETEFRNADAAWNSGSAETGVSTGSSTGASAPRDNPHRNEIEQFLEEVGRRRPSSYPPASYQQRGDAARGSISAPPPLPRPPARQQSPPPMPAPAQRTSGSAGRVKQESQKTAPSTAPQTTPPRPGAELAQRKAPVSGDLGAQVRAHLSQYLESSRLSQRAKAELGSAVERAVREHLGTTATRGTQDQESVAGAVELDAPIVTLLRNPAGVRTAILVNEILERPKCLRRKT